MKQSKIGRFTPPTFKTYYEVTVIMTKQYQRNYRYTSQQIRRERSEVDPTHVWPLVFDKSTKAIQQRTTNFLCKCCQKNWIVIILVSPMSTIINYHKLGGLKQKKIYSFSVMQTRSPKSRCQHIPSESSRGNFVPCFFQLLEASLAQGHITAISAAVVIPPPPLSLYVSKIPTCDCIQGQPV